MTNNVLVLGAGNIGSLISILFSHYPNDYSVVLADRSVKHLDKQLYDSQVITLVELDATNENDLSNVIKKHNINIIVSALPYSLNKLVATIAVNHNAHYFDLTEDVSVKNHLVELGKTAKTVLMPQCGLAPGMINIVGHHLMKQFDVVHDAKLRVGALPQTISNSLRYSLTWSTNGLVNEYGNPCEAVVDGKFVDNLQPLDGIESLLLEGVEYEAFNTSGGLGTLAETWEGQVRNLNYKTLRYPGHAEKIKFLMFDLGLNKKRAILENILEEAIPTTEDDVIVIHSSVNGFANGKFVEKAYTNHVHPQFIVDRMWTGIQVTTAAGACAAVDLMLNHYPTPEGFVGQEAIDFNDFIINRFGVMYAKGE